MFILKLDPNRNNESSSIPEVEVLGLALEEDKGNAAANPGASVSELWRFLEEAPWRTSVSTVRWLCRNSIHGFLYGLFGG